MKQKLKSRKGATLAELIIVLAIVVIAAGMTVTFSSMMHASQGISNARHEALQDVRTAEALIEGFIENNAVNTIIITKDFYATDSDAADGKKYSDKISTIDESENEIGCIYLMNVAGENSIFYITENEVGEDKKNPLISLEHIEKITFEACSKNGFLETNDEKVITIDPSVDILYYCTITYEVADTPYTYTFCVNPYVGEGVN